MLVVDDTKLIFVDGAYHFDLLVLDVETERLINYQFCRLQLML